MPARSTPFTAGLVLGAAFCRDPAEVTVDIVASDSGEWVPKFPTKG